MLLDHSRGLTRFFESSLDHRNTQEIALNLRGKCGIWITRPRPRGGRWPSSCPPLAVPWVVHGGEAWRWSVGRRASSRPAVSETDRQRSVDGGRAEELRLKRLRDRLYTPSATESDLSAYLDAAPADNAAPAAVPASDRDQGPALRLRSLTVAIALVLAAVAAAVLPGLGSRVTDLPPTRTGVGKSDLTPVSLLDPREQREVRALLLARPDTQDAALARLVTRIGAGGSSARSANFAALVGSASGSVRVPLGALGTTAAGHALTVTVASTDGRYGWKLRADAGGSARTTVARASTSSTGVVSAAAVAIPRGLSDLTITFDMPASTRFAYSVVVSN